MITKYYITFYYFTVRVLIWVIPNSVLVQGPTRPPFFSCRTMLLAGEQYFCSSGTWICYYYFIHIFYVSQACMPKKEFIIYNILKFFFCALHFQCKPNEEATKYLDTIHMLNIYIYISKYAMSWVFFLWISCTILMNTVYIHGSCSFKYKWCLKWKKKKFYASSFTPQLQFFGTLICCRNS